MFTVVLWVVAGALLLVSRPLVFRLEEGGVRWGRLYGIVAGACGGVAVGLVAATLLNPWVGLQAGTFFNLAILAFCLGFLGLCTGSLAGLLYAGMTLSSTTRIDDEDSGPDRWVEAFSLAREPESVSRRRDDDLAPRQRVKPVDDQPEPDETR